MTDSPDALRCSFKVCSQPRAVKASGERHQLCKEHRERANRSSGTRCGLRWRAPATRAGDAAQTESTLSFRDISDLLDDDTPLRVECKEDDLKAVEALLSD